MHIGNTGTEDPPTRISVVVADGDRLSRVALKDALRARGPFVIAAEATDGVHAVELALHYRPDLLVTESVLPRIDGLEVIRRVAEAAPEVRSVLLTRRDDEKLGLAALRRGASGVISKADHAEAISDALFAVHRGEAAIPDSLTVAVIRQLRRVPEPGGGLRPVHSTLTDREWEVLDLLLAGADTAEIADRLKLTHDTVISHMKNIMRKLGVRSRAAVLEAAQRLLEPASAV